MGPRFLRFLRFLHYLLCCLPPHCLGLELQICRLNLKNYEALLSLTFIVSVEALKQRSQVPDVVETSPPSPALSSDETVTVLNSE